MSSPFALHLQRLHEAHAALRDGEVASYIPELATADPDWFGICVASTDGHVYEVGDSRRSFTIQSMSKPFVYGLALQDRGREAVRRKIGVEPSGEAFNSISLAQGTGCPLNPMINAGAIAAASLVAGHTDEDRWHRVLETHSLFAGRRLGLDERVYVSERDTGHRNRAIAHMLRNFDVIETDPEPALDRYFRQCAISVTCRDLSIMAATLANGGLNPLTGERALAPELVQDVLSVMASCGMYDYAGEWLFDVGLPAKSGVGGGVLAVLPGRLGIAVFSPPLDEHGNSVRGVRVCHELSRDLELHFLRVRPDVGSAVRAVSTACELSSKRRRSEVEREILAERGARVRIWELQGELDFPAVELVTRDISGAAHDLEFAVIDLRRVTRIGEVASRLLAALARELAGSKRRLLIASAQRHSSFVRSLATAHEEGEPAHARVFTDLDRALEWCEDRLLGGRRPPQRDAPPLPLAAYAICRGLDDDALAQLEALLVYRCIPSGQLIVRAGDAADRIYLLARGEVSVTIDQLNGERTRLATLGPGMCFGELAIVNRAARTADVRADTSVECWEMSVEAFDCLGETAPALKATLVENLLRSTAALASRLSIEASALSRYVEPEALGTLKAPASRRAPPA
jgi:glutaminase